MAGAERDRGWAALRVAGCAGAVALAGGAWAVVAGAFPTAALAVAVAGAGVLVVAWFLAARAVLGGAPPPDGWSVRTAVLWTAPVALAPPLFSKDVYSYLAQGATAARGLDPHVVAPSAALPPASAVLGRVDGYWRDTPSPYGPVTDAVQQGIALLGGDDAVVGVALHRLVAVLALAGVVVVLPRLAAAGIGSETALVLGALQPLAVFHLVGGVHNDGPMLALALAGVAAALRGTDGRRGPGAAGRVAAGVLLVGLGVLVKAPAVVALVVVAVVVARRVGGGVGGLAAGAAATGAGLAAVVGGAAVLTGRGLSWVWATAAPATLGSWLAPTNWFGFAAGGVGALAGASITDQMLAAGRAGGAVLTVVAVAVVAARQLRGRTDPVTALGLVLGAVVVFGPVVQPWYLLWALVPLAASPLRGRARTVLTGVAAVVALVVPPLAGNFAGRVGGLVVAYLAAAVVVALVYALLRRVTGRRVAV